MKDTQYSKLNKQLAEIILNSLKSQILEHINISKREFVIGPFPYWESDSKFITRNNKMMPYISDVKKVQAGHLKASITFDNDFQNEVFEKYGIALYCELDILITNDADFIEFKEESDLSILKDLEIPFLFIHDHSKALHARQFIDYFSSKLKSEISLN